MPGPRIGTGSGGCSTGRRRGAADRRQLAGRCRRGSLRRGDHRDDHPADNQGRGGLDRHARRGRCGGDGWCRCAGRAACAGCRHRRSETGGRGNRARRLSTKVRAGISAGRGRKHPNCGAGPWRGLRVACRSARVGTRDAGQKSRRRCRHRVDHLLGHRYQGAAAEFGRRGGRDIGKARNAEEPDDQNAADRLPKTSQRSISVPSTAMRTSTPRCRERSDSSRRTSPSQI